MFQNPASDEAIALLTHISYIFTPEKWRRRAHTDSPLGISEKLLENKIDFLFSWNGCDRFVDNFQIHFFLLVSVFSDSLKFSIKGAGYFLNGRSFWYFVFLWVDVGRMFW